jgi:hypothetical protein
VIRSSYQQFLSIAGSERDVASVEARYPTIGIPHLDHIARLDGAVDQEDYAADEVGNTFCKPRPMPTRPALTGKKPGEVMALRNEALLLRVESV